MGGFVVDWDVLTDADLAPEEYLTATNHDALNRVKSLQYPNTQPGDAKILRPGHNRAGALDHIEFDGDTYVEHIAYNAKGQRTLIAYGNGVMTRYAYDEKTFRLQRLRSNGYREPTPYAYQS